MVQQTHSFLIGERVKVVQGSLASHLGTVGTIHCLLENNEVLILLEESKDNKQEWVCTPAPIIDLLLMKLLGRTSLPFFGEVE